MRYTDNNFSSHYLDDYIEHSWGPWKKHKYISKIGTGVNAIYKYAGDAVSSAGKAINGAVNSVRSNASRFGAELKKQFSPVNTSGSKKVGKNTYISVGDAKLSNSGSKKKNVKSAVKKSKKKKYKRRLL